MNTVNILGRMCRDAEIKTYGDKSKATFTVAVNAGKDKTDFIPVEAWNGTADMVGKYFPKGRMIAIEGRLAVNQWEDDSGKHSRMVVVASRVHFCGDKASQSPAAADDWTVDAAEAEQLPF